MKQTLAVALGGEAGEFVVRRWARVATVTHGPLARLAPLCADPTVSNVARLCARLARTRATVSAFPARLARTRYDPDPWPADAAELALARGMTLNVTSIAELSSACHDWIHDLVDGLGLGPARLVSHNLFVSPGARGMSMHYDAHEAIVVQLVGRKRWQIGQNQRDPWPAGGSDLFRDRFAYAPISVELRPGSILWLPRGHWHATCSGSEPSISLSVFVATPTLAERGITAPGLARQPSLPLAAALGQLPLAPAPAPAPMRGSSAAGPRWRVRSDLQLRRREAGLEVLVSGRCVHLDVAPRFEPLLRWVLLEAGENDAAQVGDTWARISSVREPRPPTMLDGETLLLRLARVGLVVPATSP